MFLIKSGHPARCKIGIFAFGKKRNIQVGSDSVKNLVTQSDAESSQKSNFLQWSFGHTFGHTVTSQSGHRMLWVTVVTVVLCNVTLVFKNIHFTVTSNSSHCGFISTSLWLHIHVTWRHIDSQNVTI